MSCFGLADASGLEVLAVLWSPANWGLAALWPLAICELVCELVAGARQNTEMHHTHVASWDLRLCDDNIWGWAISKTVMQEAFWDHPPRGEQNSRTRTDV